MLEIGQSETLLPADSTAWRAAFAKQRALVLRDAIPVDLMRKLTMLIGRSHFVSNRIDGLGHREIESPPVAGKAIDLLLSRSSLFRWLEHTTGCESIMRVGGAIARTWPNSEDHLDWHDDLNTPESSSRRLAITIALDELEYEGGLFELRNVGSSDPLFSFKHDRLGTAVIFEISGRLEHRVAPLISGGPRLVYAGWFVG
ncbi:2OG-Fe(II) oxygenase [Sphingomonas baiyangensis]|uniref:2OG-Fe(II) oxygenase n=1 Tax=Sphingomonas baiyangensis TaxID=2572576 RepID=A0A4U1L3W5_9SPHN|nr:2OG-Fe(II) oxygenase [Sphingomonas baiyangensis]TKD51579.1 2OG-Fe(II) oxygenase [Sphingomonas baiyangensis]